MLETQAMMAASVPKVNQACKVHREVQDCVVPLVYRVPLERKGQGEAQAVWVLLVLEVLRA